MDKTGKEVVTPKYDSIIALMYSDFISVSNNKKFGFLNKEFKEIIETKYDDYAELYGDLVAVKQNGKWGILNTKNEVIQPFKYDRIEGVNDDEAEGSIGNKLYRINYQGEASPK